MRSEAIRHRLSPAQRLARWRRLRLLAWLVAVLLGASVLTGWAGLFGRAGDDWAAFDRQRFQVVRVLDGDTLLVRPASGGGDETRVRLVGVAAPELRDPSASPSAHWAAEAKQSLAARADGKAVTLRLEATQTRAADGSLLAHVYLADAAELNLDLIRDGHAFADRRRPHSMRNQFDQAETDARLKRRGMWKDLTEAQMPEWRREWLRALRAKRPDRPVRPSTREARP